MLKNIGMILFVFTLILFARAGVPKEEKVASIAPPDSISYYMVTASIAPPDSRPFSLTIDQNENPSA